MKFLVTETQMLVCCLYSRNSQTFRVSTGSSGHNRSPFPISQSKGQNWQTGTRHYFPHAHRAETRQPQNSTNMETLKLDKFFKRYLPTLVSDDNQYHNWLSHGPNLWHMKLQYKTDRWRWNEVPCYRPSNSRRENNYHRINYSFVSRLKTFDRYEWFLCQVCKTLIITLLTSHSSFISECSPIQLLRPIKHNVAFLTSFNANEPVLRIFNASDMSWEHRFWK